MQNILNECHLLLFLECSLPSLHLLVFTDNLLFAIGKEIYS